MAQEKGPQGLPFLAYLIINVGVREIHGGLSFTTLTQLFHSFHDSKCTYAPGKIIKKVPLKQWIQLFGHNSSVMVDVFIPEKSTAGLPLSMGSALVDVTNCELKIFRKKRYLH